MPTTPGETPEVMTREEMAGLISKLHHKLAHPNERTRELESALTAAREEAHTLYTQWQAMSLTVERMREERDRAQDALRLAETALLSGNQIDGMGEKYLIEGEPLYKALNAIRSALKPVSDRQPEGEKP